MIANKYKNDLKKFTSKYSQYVESIHLFGSSLDKEHGDVNDIDIAIIVKNTSLSEFKNIIDNYEFLLETRCASANGQYVGGGGGKGPIDYHFVLLDYEHMNEKFVSLNPNMKRII